MIILGRHTLRAVCAAFVLMSLLHGAFAAEPGTLFYSGDLNGAAIVRHVGTRGDLFSQTPLVIAGKLTRMELTIARIVGTGSRLPDSRAPIVHELVMDGQLRAAPGAPPQNYRGTVYLALYHGDELAATMSLDLTLEKEQQRRYSSAAISTRDLFELPEDAIKKVTRYELRYYESAN